jgi:hypothetical protein
MAEKDAAVQALPPDPDRRELRAVVLDQVD